ncbi:MAG: ATP-binding protein, partial [Planctomycetaceae bacterium]
PDPTADENLERPCGRGIHLMRAFMNRIEYNERGNRVLLEKCKTYLEDLPPVSEEGGAPKGFPLATDRGATDSRSKAFAAQSATFHAGQPISASNGFGHFRT